MAYGACSYLINDIEENLEYICQPPSLQCEQNFFFSTPATTKCIKIALGMLR